MHAPKSRLSLFAVYPKAVNQNDRFNKNNNKIAHVLPALGNSSELLVLPGVVLRAGDSIGHYSSATGC